MPIRHGDILAKWASTRLRDHFCRNTIAPRRSRPTMWKQFLPISMPTTAISLLSFSDMAVLLGFAAPRQPFMLAGSEHGRTIPLADLAAISRTSLIAAVRVSPRDADLT